MRKFTYFLLSIITFIIIIIILGEGGEDGTVLVLRLADWHLVLLPCCDREIREGVCDNAFKYDAESSTSVGSRYSVLYVVSLLVYVVLYCFCLPHKICQIFNFRKCPLRLTLLSVPVFYKLRVIRTYGRTPSIIRTQGCACASPFSVETCRNGRTLL